MSVLFILSSPSGAGKTTVTKYLLKMNSNLRRSISMTTREPRAGEKDGIDYFFVTKSEFERYIENKHMLEYASVFGNYYGTPKEYVETLLGQGINVICCIDWQGAVQIKKMMEDAVTIFLLPPSMKILGQRLQTRASDDQETIKRRLNEAKYEISQATQYNYIVINDDLEITIATVNSILQTENLKKRDSKIIIDNLLREEGF